MKTKPDIPARAGRLAAALLLSALPLAAQGASPEELCEDIGTAQPAELDAIKQDLKQWLLDDIDTANLLMAGETAAELANWKMRDLAESVLLAEAEAARLAAEADGRGAREDAKTRAEIERLNTSLRLLDEKYANLRAQRDAIGAARVIFAAVQAEIAELERQIAVIDSGSYKHLQYPAEHERQHRVLAIQDLQARLDEPAGRVGQTFGLGAAEWPRDQAGLVELERFGQQEWNAYAAQRSALEAQVREQRRRLTAAGEPLPGLARVEQLQERARKMQQYIDGLEQDDPFREIRQGLAASQAAFRQLWDCVKERERAPGSGSTQTAAQSGGSRMITGQWEMTCDHRYIKKLRGTFRLTVGSTGETYGEWWEEDGDHGTITGVVRDGLVDWGFLFLNDRFAARGNLYSGRGTVQTEELSAYGRCAGPWVAD